MATLFCNQIITLQKLLHVITEERKKSRIKNDISITNVINTFWMSLFEEYFLQNTSYADDLIFYVKKDDTNLVFIDVVRRSSQQNNVNFDKNIDWEETVYLNLILQQFEYTLTCSICTRTGPKDLQILKRHSQPVYASPSRRQMDRKGEEEAITYPNLFFMVDNYEEVFGDIMVKEGELVCIELVAQDKQDTLQGVIFLGAVRYQALKKVYENKATMATKLAERISMSGKHQPRTEFIKMKGPNGVGQAEIAITAKVEKILPAARPQNCTGTWPRKFSSISAPTTPGQNSPEPQPDFNFEDVLNGDAKTNPGRKPQPYRRNRWGGSFSTIGGMLTSWYSGSREEISKETTPSSLLPSPTRANFRCRGKSASQSNVLSSSSSHVNHHHDLIRSYSKIGNGSLPNGILANSLTSHLNNAVKNDKISTACHELELNASTKWQSTSVTVDSTDAITAQFNGNTTQILSSKDGGGKRGKRSIQNASVALMARVTYVSVPWQTIIENLFEHRQKPILTF